MSFTPPRGAGLDMVTVATLRFSRLACMRFRSGQVLPASGSLGQGSIVRSLSGVSSGSSDAQSVVLYKPSAACPWHVSWLARAAAAAKPVGEAPGAAGS